MVPSNPNSGNGLNPYAAVFVPASSGMIGYVDTAAWPLGPPELAQHVTPIELWTICHDHNSDNLQAHSSESEKTERRRGQEEDEWLKEESGDTLLAFECG